MRIAIASQNFVQANNGQAVFARNLAKRLADGGHEVLCLTPSDRGEPYRVEEGQLQIAAITSVALKPFYPDVRVSFWADRAVSKLLDEFHPDVVHIQDHFPLCRAVVRKARARSIPLLGTNHFLPENLVPYIPILGRIPATRRLVERILWRQVRVVFSAMDAVAAPSRTAACILEREAGIPSVVAISCGVDVEAWQADPSLEPSAARAVFGLPEEGVGVLYLGRVDREKRVDVLVRAVADLGCSEVWLAVAGTGSELAALKRLARRTDGSARVYFLGFIAEPALPVLLRAADVFAMPSEAELLSIATLEAMAAGLPVLAANARALPELVEHGVNGYLFRPGDASDAAHWLRALACDGALRRRMGEAGRQRATAHALPQTVAAYEKMYQDVLARRR
ncbi:MAG: glycosyltransferase [Chthonomonadales bacterium]